MTTPSTYVVRKLRATSRAAATGTTIRALINSTPTPRIEITTVSAVSLASTRLSRITGRPPARANSSSLLTANNAGPNTVVALSTTAASTAKTARSDTDVVVIVPNRYWVRLRPPDGARLASTTPPAMPP